MTSRVSYTPQDFQKMCKQAERDNENKKLVFLMERLKRQLAERSDGGIRLEKSKLPGAAVSSDARSASLPVRSLPLER